MMKYDIIERYNGSVLATADIDCSPDASVGVKNGLALKWAVANSVNVEHADFQHASLNGASLNGANLHGVNLMDAELQGVDLYSADLRGASLGGADLLGAVLTVANLSHADLQGVNLTCAKLRSAYFASASLYQANLEDADATGADFRKSNMGEVSLKNTSIRWATGDNSVLRSIQTGRYQVVISPDVMAIGCKQYPIKVWWYFSDKDINSMDRGALEWWKKWRHILKAIVEGK